MLGMGWGEIGFVLVIALVVLGPEKIPSVARTLGKGIRMLRRATNDLRRAVEIESVRDDIRAQIQGVKSSIPDPYAAVRAEERAWHAGEIPEPEDLAPPGAIEGGFDEPNPVWELTDHVSVAPLEALQGEPAAVTVPMIAVPVRHLADLHTVPVWGGAQGLKAWLDRPAAPEPTRELTPGLSAQRLPVPVPLHQSGVQSWTVPLTPADTSALTRLSLPAIAPGVRVDEHKEAS